MWPFPAKIKSIWLGIDSLVWSIISVEKLRRVEQTLSQNFSYGLYFISCSHVSVLGLRCTFLYRFSLSHQMIWQGMALLCNPFYSKLYVVLYSFVQGPSLVKVIHLHVFDFNKSSSEILVKKLWVTFTIVFPKKLFTHHNTLAVSNSYKQMNSSSVHTFFLPFRRYAQSFTLYSVCCASISFHLIHWM